MPFYKTQAELDAYFWARVDQSAGETGCWPWLGRVNNWGYGRLWRLGKNESAHRVAFLISGGSLLPGELVLHSCDRPTCCNPLHLRAGTQSENMRERTERGRTPKTPHISGDRKAQIAEAVRHGKPWVTIAAEMHVGGTTVRRIARACRHHLTVTLTPSGTGAKGAK
jgi:hypothetical protein